MEVVFRADASSKMGTGHLMRCLALAQYCADHGAGVTFVTACDNPVLLQRLHSEGFHVVRIEHPYPDPSDWDTTEAVLQKNPGAWVVLDGYHFDTTYQDSIRSSGHELLVWDDAAHLGCYSTDVILNQNLHAGTLNYHCKGQCDLLLGNKYVVLRREFDSFKTWNREIPSVAKNILVTLGGADRENHTLKVVKGLLLLDLHDINIRVVLGPANCHYHAIREAVTGSVHDIKLIQHTEEIAQSMAWADLAISSGGSTVWELAFMATPTVVGCLSDVEALSVAGLRAAGICLCFGWYGDFDSSQIASLIEDCIYDSQWRQNSSDRSRELFDGRGAERVFQRIVKGCGTWRTA